MKNNNNGAAGAMKEHKLYIKKGGNTALKFRGVQFLPLRKLVTTSEPVHGLCFLYIYVYKLYILRRTRDVYIIYLF